MTNLFDSPDYIQPDKKTISEGQATHSLREAWKTIYGQYPSDQSLAIIWGKTCLETGRFKKGLWNWNFGNIKKVLNDPNNHDKFTMYRCNEIINNQVCWFDPPHPQTAFRSYESLVDGAESYIRFVSQKARYKKAWQKVIDGDPAGYVHELKLAGYFSAVEDVYKAGVLSLFNEFLRRKDELLSWHPETPNFVQSNTEIHVPTQEEIYAQQLMTLINYD